MVHVPPVGVDVNRSTMYLVPVVEPAIVAELPVKDVRPPVDEIVLDTVTLTVDEAAFTFPTESVNDPAETVITPVPPEDKDVVYVTEYDVLEFAVNPDSDPSVALKSAIVKVDDASLSMMVIVVDAPELKDESAAVIDETVGVVVSMTNALFAPREPEAPGAGSVNVALLAATSTTVPPARDSDEVAT